MREKKYIQHMSNITSNLTHTILFSYFTNFHVKDHTFVLNASFVLPLSETVTVIMNSNHSKLEVKVHLHQILIAQGKD